MAYGSHSAGSDKPQGFTVKSFLNVSGLSRRQRSLPAVHHYFCCRAVAIRPRESLLVPVTLCYLIKLGGESEIIRFGVSIDALF